MRDEFKDDIYENWKEKPYRREISDKVVEALTNDNKKAEEIWDDEYDKALDVIADYLIKKDII
jgi:hypothetical protein